MSTADDAATTAASTGPSRPQEPDHASGVPRLAAPGPHRPKRRGRPTPEGLVEALPLDPSVAAPLWVRWPEGVERIGQDVGLRVDFVHRVRRRGR